MWGPSAIGARAQRTAAWRIWLGLCTCAVALTAGCATGMKAPDPTPMAAVSTGLTFLFGLGVQGCGIPTPTECKTQQNSKFDPGTPAVLVSLKPFEIDVHEVTNAQYRYCVAMEVCSLNAGDNTTNIPDYYAKPVEGGTVPNPKYDDFPVVLVNQIQAEEYCKFVGKRLPSEFEWERVASGAAQVVAEKRIYPFGEAGPRSSPAECTAHDINLYGCRLDERPSRVGSATADFATVDGGKVWDLFGNAYEWTSSRANDRLGCDTAGQPYTCEGCVQCLSINPRGVCAAQCLGCACGDGPTATKPNCYKPCDTPICAAFPASAQPLEPGALLGEPTDQYVIRGGAFAKGSGQKGIGPCEGRADHRSFVRSKGDPHVALGFRCARDL